MDKVNENFELIGSVYTESDPKSSYKARIYCWINGERKIAYISRKPCKGSQNHHTIFIHKDNITEDELDILEPPQRPSPSK